MHQYSYTEISDYLRCRYKHDLRWNQGYTPRVDPYPMSLGSAVHFLLECAWKRYANGQSSMLTSDDMIAWEKKFEDRPLSDEERFELGTILQDAVTITINTIKYVDFPRWEVMVLDGEPLIEFKIKHPYENFVGHIDLVARDKDTGQSWLIDWKTRGQLLPEDAEDVNLQMKIYTHLLLENNIDVVGYRILQIRNKVPSEPSLNADGRMSRARIATTWEKYEDALLRNGLNPDHYQEMKTKLDVEFFRWEKVYCGEWEAHSVWTDIVMPVISDIGFQFGPIRNMNYMNCNGCWARDYCLEDLRGGDTAYIIENDFIKLEDVNART